MTPNGSLIDEIVREGARRMLAAALEAEVNGYLAELAEQRDEAGRRLVVRNGFHAERTISTSAGLVQVKAPRVNDQRVDADDRGAEAVLLGDPAAVGPEDPEDLRGACRCCICTACPPATSSRRWSSSSGSAAGLSSATCQRLTAQWTEDHKAFQGRDLSKTDFVYVWADGVHLKVRLDEAKACVLVMVGVRADGSKELIALDEGYRESGESWANLLRDCRPARDARPGARRRRRCAGVLEGAARGVPRDSRSSAAGCTRRRMFSDALPKSAQPAAKNAIADIYNAEDKEHASTAVRAFAKQYAAKFPKAVTKIVDDQDVLLAFYDYPAEHWIHLRTTNPIESTFATVRLRTKVTRGAGSRAAALAMTFKLIESAQERWRAVNAPHLVALVRAGARFDKGVLVEREQVTAA